MSHEQLVARGDVCSPWQAVRGFNVFTCFEDLMHVVYMGFARDFLSSIFCELVEDTADPELELRKIKRQYDTFCKRKGLQRISRRFTLNLLGRKNKWTYPHLQHSVKACTVKVLISFVADLLRKREAPTEHDKVLATAAWALADFLHVLDHSDFIMGDADASAAYTSGNHFATLYQYLSAEAEHQGRCLFHMRPKVHYFCHLVDDIIRSKINPGRISCMVSEDFVGKSARLTSKVHKSTYALRTLQRYMIVLRKRWK